MDQTKKRKRSCHALSLADKVKIIREVENRVRKKKDIAAEFGIPANTLSNILNQKEKYLSALDEGGFQPSRKRLKLSSVPLVEKAVFKFTSDLRASHPEFPIGGDVLQEKAKSYATDLGYENFHASPGWLRNFKKRNGLSSKVMSGESASVPEEDCQNYINDVLPGLLENYSENDVFNADETGLFWRCLPNKTLAFKKEDCHGGKQSKERITVLVAANMSGTEKLPLLIIGKSKKPHCFGKTGVKSLPVTYTNNKKAWMNSEEYEAWLQRIDARFRKRNRKILLFVDNCPAHPKKLKCQLQAVKVVHLPPNTTSKLQPMDMGIIKNLKFYYRKRLVKKLLDAISKNNDLSINLLQAITLLTKAWDDVKAATISNCFRKAGFKKLIEPVDDIENSLESAEELIEPSEWIQVTMAMDCTGVTFQEFTNVDESVIIAEKLTDEDILAMVTQQESQDFSSEESENEIELHEAKISTARATVLLTELRNFVQQQENMPQDVFKALNFLDDYCESKVPQTQSKLTDFFRNK